MIPAVLPPRSLPGNTAGLDRRACTPSSEHRSDRTRTHGNPSTPAPATERWTATRTSGHNEGGVRAVLGGPGTPQVCSSWGPWASVLPGSWTSSTTNLPIRAESIPLTATLPTMAANTTAYSPTMAAKTTTYSPAAGRGSHADRQRHTPRPWQPRPPPTAGQPATAARPTDSPPTMAAKTYSPAASPGSQADGQRHSRTDDCAIPGPRRPSHRPSRRSRDSSQVDQSWQVQGWGSLGKQNRVNSG